MSASIQSLPAPVGGWNARDSVADMGPSDAVELINWFPYLNECILRNGYSNWSTGLPGQVETIMSYAGGTTDKLFAASVAGIYDCTTKGAVGAAAVAGLTNARFQYINNATAGGNYLLAVNGADKMRYFDGTTWSVDGGTFTVTVADTAQWSTIALHKQRVWGIVKNSLTAYYLPAAAIAGAAALFDMRPFFKKGGYIQQVETLTLDGGQGLDDHLVFISNKGEALVYKGTDPSSVSTWTMVGLYQIGSPIGKRCMIKWRGDILVINQDGLMPLSRALFSERVDERIALSDKIQNAISIVIDTAGANFGWQIIDFPKQNMLILNVPVSTGGQEQYVMSTLSQAWGRFTGWAANCWELWKDDAYFGANGVVNKAWDTNADNGMNIQSSALQAYSRFGSSNQKRFTMTRPVFRSNGIPSVRASLSIDYDSVDTTVPLSFTPVAAAGTWGTGTWGSSLWGSGALSIYKNWQGAQGVGLAAAPRIKTASQGFDLRWVSTDVIFERGAFI